MSFVQIQPREVVSERHIVDATLLEETPGEPMECGMVRAREYVVTGEKRPRFGDVFGDELVVGVESSVAVAAD